MKYQVFFYSVTLILLLCGNNYSQSFTWYEEYGSVHYHEWGEEVVQTGDGGYFAVGNRYPYSAGLLLKTDSLGNQQWIKSIWNPEALLVVNSFDTTLDSGYIYTGHTVSGRYHLYIAKTNLDGQKLWDKIYGFEELGRSIKNVTTG